MVSEVLASPDEFSSGLLGLELMFGILPVLPFVTVGFMMLMGTHLTSSRGARMGSKPFACFEIESELSESSF